MGNRPLQTAELIRLRYEFLRRMARRFLRSEPRGFDLAPTDLVHQACVKLLAEPEVAWQGTAHFRGILSRKMKQALIDHVRLCNSKKRGGAGREGAAGAHGNAGELTLDVASSGRGGECGSEAARITVAEAMRALEQESIRLWLTVGLRCLCGVGSKTTAQYLGVCESTVEKDLRYASAWLRSKLAGPTSDAH